MTATAIDGKAIAARMVAEVRAEAAELTAAGWEPRLVSISVGDVAAAELYVRNQQKSALAAVPSRGWIASASCVWGLRVPVPIPAPPATGLAARGPQ